MKCWYWGGNNIRVNLSRRELAFNNSFETLFVRPSSWSQDFLAIIYMYVCILEQFAYIIINKYIRYGEFI